MSPDRLIVEAIKVAQDLLRQNLSPMHNLTDAGTVLRLRELVHSPSIRSALDRSSDTLLAFALRAVERALCSHSRPHRETIDLVWDILDDPHLNKALGLPQNSRMAFRRPRFWCFRREIFPPVVHQMSGALLPPSPPAEKAAACEDQAGKPAMGAGTDAGDNPLTSMSSKPQAPPP
jgi:hypothetical protein